jgi:thiamine pyrophosphokinase
MNLIAIVGGNNNSEDLISEIIKADYIIGVDRGAWWLLAHGIVPGMAIGDFDSLTKKELVSVTEKIPNVVQYDRVKDWTDMELAIAEALKLKPNKIDVFGATGGRLDHELANCFLLVKCLEKGIPATIIDVQNRLTLCNSSTDVAQLKEYRYFSVLSFVEKSVVSIQGAKFPLDHFPIVPGQTIGVSNEITGKTARVIVHKGTVVVIQSRDA